MNRRDPARPVDDTVRTILVKDENGGCIAVAVSFACHPTVLDHHNLLYSADYPGACASVVQRALEVDSPVLFLNGACADVNPIRRAADFSEIHRFGLTLGGEVTKIVGGLLVAGAQLQSDNLLWGETLALPAVAGRTVGPTLVGLREPLRLELKRFEAAASYQERIAELSRLAEQAGSADERRRIVPELLALRAEASSAKVAEYYLAQTEGELETEVQLLVLGEGDRVAVLGVPGELSSELGSELQGMWDGELLIAAYTNDYVGYLVAERAYSEGGYEPGRAIVESSTAERLRGAVRRLFERYRAQQERAPGSEVGKARA